MLLDTRRKDLGRKFRCRGYSSCTLKSPPRVRNRPKAESLYTSASACKSPGHSLAKPGMFALSLVIDLPTANTEMLSESALYTGYASWCRASDREALPVPEFVTGLDQLRTETSSEKSASARIATAASASSPPNVSGRSPGSAGEAVAV